MLGNYLKTKSCCVIREELIKLIRRKNFYWVRIWKLITRKRRIILDPVAKIVNELSKLEN